MIRALCREQRSAESLMAWEKHNQYGIDTACTCTIMSLRLDISQPGRDEWPRSLDRSGQQRYGRGRINKFSTNTQAGCEHRLDERE